MILFAAELIDTVLATVDDVPITLGELEAAYFFEVGPFDKLPKEVIDRLLKDQISGQLMLLYIREKYQSDISLDDAQAEMERRIKLIGEDKFNAFSAEHGLGNRPFLTVMQRVLAFQQVLFGEIQPRITVSIQEMKEYFRKNRDKFSLPEGLKVKGKVFESKAEALRFLSSGGRLDDFGIVRKGQLAKQIEKVLFSTPVGKTTGPIKGPDGRYYVFKVEKKVPPKRMKFEEVKDQIRTMLLGEKAQERINKIIEKYKRKHVVIVFEK